MMLQRWIKALAVVGVLAACGSEAYGFGGRRAAKSCCDSGCAAPASCGGCADGCGTAAPQYMTVTVCEYVPQQYEAIVTKYRTEWKDETVMVNQCNWVSEPQTRTYTCMVAKMETVMQDVTRCTMERSQETKQIVVTRCVPKTVTEMVNRTVDRGHYECQAVPCSTQTYAAHHRAGICGRRKSSCGGCTSSCNSCGNGCGGCGDGCAVSYTMRNVWVSNCVTEQVPVTCTKYTMVQEPQTVTYTVCRPVSRTEKVACNVCKWVPETKTETCNVMVAKMSTVPVTRKVCVSVPYQEKVTCTRMVPTYVQKQVPCGGCTTSCSSGCGSSCHTACATSSCGKTRRGGRASRGSSCGGCSAGCSTGCGGCS